MATSDDAGTLTPDDLERLGLVVDDDGDVYDPASGDFADGD